LSANDLKFVGQKYFLAQYFCYIFDTLFLKGPPKCQRTSMT
jgi:hypothetical protein